MSIPDILAATVYISTVQQLKVLIFAEFLLHALNPVFPLVSSFMSCSSFTQSSFKRLSKLGPISTASIHSPQSVVLESRFRSSTTYGS